MRHRKRGRHLGRTSSHRQALRRNLARNLLIHERIRTTREKAREVAPFVEKLITLARKPESLAGFRRALALLDDKPVVRKLFAEIGPRYRERNGGYTRILALSSAERRLGDNASQVIFELVAETPEGEQAKAVEGKQSIGDRIKQRIRGPRAEAPEPEGEVEAEGETDADVTPPPAEDGAEEPEGEAAAAEEEGAEAPPADEAKSDTPESC